MILGLALGCSAMLLASLIDLVLWGFNAAFWPFMVAVAIGGWLSAEWNVAKVEEDLDRFRRFEYEAGGYWYPEEGE